jgi:hypothetical protein
MIDLGTPGSVSKGGLAAATEPELCESGTCRLADSGSRRLIVRPRAVCRAGRRVVTLRGGGVEDSNLRGCCGFGRKCYVGNQCLPEGSFAFFFRFLVGGVRGRLCCRLPSAG